MTRVIGWVAQRVGARALLVVALLLLSMASIAGMVASRVRSLDNTLLISMSAAGTLLAWVIARSRLRERLALPIIGLAGVLIIVVQVGNMETHGAQLIKALYNLDLAVRGNWRDINDALKLVFTALNSLGSDLYTLANRALEWLGSIARQKALFDPVATAMVWSGVFWAVAAWAAWGIRRKSQALGALLPSLALLLAICAYTGVDNLVILVWPFFSLLILIALVGHAAREADWESRRVDYSEDIRFDLTLVVTPIAVVLVAVAWFVPSISLDQIAGAVRQALSEPSQQAQPMSNSLGLAPRPAPTVVLPQLRAPGLPRSHLIGSGPDLSRRQVMSISTGDLPPEPQYGGLTTRSAPRYYWRSTVYDHYIGSGWSTSEIVLNQYAAGTIAITYTVSAQCSVRQRVQAIGDLGGLVFTAGALVAADRDYGIAWRSTGDAFSAPLKQFAETYTADSIVSTASVDKLRTVTADYPELTKQRYLQLPEDTPQRIYTLARNLTATEPTPYDRATAIESYLRTYSYTLNLPPPPVGHDVADTFLFELKRGYCDYFATAMVVLARASGLPARMVVGYATGAYDPYNARYVVTEADAHSWPEVYFNDYGWVEFEPTSGLTAITRPGVTQDTPVTPRTFVPLQPQREWIDYLDQVVVLLVLGAIVLSLPTWLVLDWWVVSRMTPDQAIRRLYERLSSHSRRLLLNPCPGDTPLEFADKLKRRIDQITAMGATPKAFRVQVIAADAARDAGYLCELNTRILYGRYKPTALDRSVAWRRWQRANLRLWLLWFVQSHQRARTIYRKLAYSARVPGV